MDYVEMIKDPELVLGFQELISDSDPAVIKRTVRVFTSVYHHTLRLLSCGELEDQILLKSWPSVKSVVDRLLAMVRHCDNEGVLIHLLRFIEAAIISHLLYDLSPFPFVFERGREVVKTGLKALKDLVTTPYVGGSPFIVGVRALISIACLRPDLWEPVTDLLKKQLVSLPPTLFDHNVRSLNKSLQRNLFRLLRRAEKPQLKEKLIEMMVGVGVPRKVIMPWAPAMSDAKKRGPPDQPPDADRSFPQEKKPRTDAEGNESASNQEAPSDPRLAAAPQDPRQGSSSTALSSSAPSAQKPPNADLMFLTSLIPLGNLKERNPSKDSIPSEKELYEKLDLDAVIHLVIRSSALVPDREPAGFVADFKEKSDVTDDTNSMRKKVAALLSQYLQESHKKDFDSSRKLNSPASSAANSPKREDPSEAKKTDSTPMESSSNSSSASSTPASTPPLADTDMRQAFSHSTDAMGDVDMRIADPRLATRDPRMLKDPRIRNEPSDPRLASHAEQPTMERLSRVDPRLSGKPPPPPPAEAKSRQDPRLAGATSNQTSKSSSEARKTRWDPRTSSQETPFSPATTAQSNPLLGPAPLTAKPSDPRTRPAQGQGLLPHPDPRTFQRNPTDQRMLGQNPCKDVQLYQNFNAQNHFPFAPMNQFNPFVGGIGLNPRSLAPAVLNGPSFPWQNNLRNPPPPSLLVNSQTLASVQSGMFPSQTVLNL